MAKKILLLFLIFCSSVAYAQDYGFYGSLVPQEEQVADVSFLSCEDAAGRASGTLGNTISAMYIADRFRNLGLAPVNWSYTQSFRYNDTTIMRNVIGILPSNVDSDEYVIVSAHYDHLGEINGRIYSGADDNASGVAVMLSLAGAFKRLKDTGVTLGKNIIFVAFDGKEFSMCGSRHFVEHLPVPRDRIVCDVNIDMIGTDLVPPGRNREYLIEVGEETLPEKYRGTLAWTCMKRPYGMQLDQSFYGSSDFRRLFYGMSDQISFNRAGIPAVVFSSAFHDHTYKITDKKEIINFPLMYKRTMVILQFVKMLCER